MKIKCVDCRYWNTLGEGHGQCRLHPPVVVAASKGTRIGDLSNSQTTTIYEYPLVDSDNWCGQAVSGFTKSD